MEGQALPRLQPLPVAEPQKQGWTSFDDSPVHTHSATTAFVQEQSPWLAHSAGKQWIPFSNSSTKADPETALVAGNATHCQPQRVQPKETLQQSLVGVPGRHVSHSLNLSGNTPMKASQPVSYQASGLPANSKNNQQTVVPKQRYGESAAQTTYAANSEVHQQVSKEEHVSYADSYDNQGDFQDPWCITAEQREYYTKQFTSMQSNLEGKIDGPCARNFFTKSKLPIPELSHIWELSDMDQDGHLTLDEFCTAFHLVVARKNGYDLPAQLPQALVPRLIDISGDAGKSSVEDAFAPEARTQPAQNLGLRQQDGESKAQDQWETFSDRASVSSANLANFDPEPGSNVANLPHPVAVRMSPSRHQEHLAQVTSMGTGGGLERRKTETTQDEEESTTSSPHTRTKQPTNPYGYLLNEFSEADSGEERENRLRPRSSSSDSTTANNAHEAQNDDKTFIKHRKTKGRSRSNSSVSSTTSSVATSDHFSGDDNFHQKADRSDLELSDWSSRPLRPRSGSSSSQESGPVPSISAPPPPVAAPTPPPRPQVHPQNTASPIPKPRPVVKSKSNSLDNNTGQKTAQESERRIDGPPPPPRPQQTAAKEVPQESFADFSNFRDQAAASPPTPTTVAAAATKPGEPPVAHKKIHKSKSVDKPPISDAAISEKTERPVPAPRPQKGAAKTGEASEGEHGRETDLDKNTLNHKKAPVKPPRTRMLSSEVSKAEPVLSPLSINSKDDAKIAAAPHQDPSRSKSALQSAIRELKCRNTHLTRLNADLQQQLKDVMEMRITVEMNIHQIRPFTQ